MTIPLEIGLNPVPRTFGYFKTYFYADVNDVRGKLLETVVCFSSSTLGLCTLVFYPPLETETSRSPRFYRGVSEGRSKRCVLTARGAWALVDRCDRRLVCGGFLGVADDADDVLPPIDVVDERRLAELAGIFVAARRVDRDHNLEHGANRGRL